MAGKIKRLIMTPAVRQALTTGQMALSAAQRAFPNLNPHRLNIQRITTCVNALLLASDYKEIYDKDYDKRDTYTFFAATAILSLGIVSLINRAGKPDLSKMFTSATGQTIAWTTPTLQKVAQWIMLNRVFTNLAIAKFSETKQKPLLNAGLQALNLISDSSASWIRITRAVSFHSADQEFNTEGNAVMDFFVPSNVEPVESVVQAANDYVSRAFESPGIVWGLDWYQKLTYVRVKIPTPAGVTGVLEGTYGVLKDGVKLIIEQRKHFPRSF
jgi:hypothetical protein